MPWRGSMVHFKAPLLTQAWKIGKGAWNLPLFLATTLALKFLKPINRCTFCTLCAPCIPWDCMGLIISTIAVHITNPWFHIAYFICQSISNYPVRQNVPICYGSMDLDTASRESNSFTFLTWHIERMFIRALQLTTSDRLHLCFDECICPIPQLPNLHPFQPEHIEL